MNQWSDSFDRVLRTYCRYADPDAALDRDALLTDLGVDSLALLALVVDLEDHFNVSFPTQMLTMEVFATPASVWKATADLSADNKR